jgi:hypothetical protein
MANELAEIFNLERGKRHALVLQKFPFVLPDMGWGAFAVSSQADWKIYSKRIWFRFNAYLVGR